VSLKFEVALRCAARKATSTACERRQEGNGDDAEFERGRERGGRKAAKWRATFLMHAAGLDAQLAANSTAEVYAANEASNPASPV
jgi:hypothetical protein